MQRKRTLTLAICFMILAGLIQPPTSIKADSITVTISTHNLNIRQGPGLSYPILGQAPKGDQYKVLSQKGDWIEIKFQGKKGWVASWLVALSTSSQENSIKTGKAQAVIKTDGLRVRKGPGTDYAVMGTVLKGASYKIQGYEGSWIKLQTPFGKGWVSSQYVQLNDNKQQDSKNQKGKITANSLNVRNKPSIHSTVIGKLNAGETVTITAQSGSWSEILFSGKSGWISSQYVQVQSPQSAGNTSEQHNTGKTGTVTATSLTVRNKGSLNGKPLGSVTKGQYFAILAESNNWSKIEYQSGSFGWVASWFMDITSERNTGSAQQPVNRSSAIILHNGSNIRKKASAQSPVIQRANQGDSFEIISLKSDWYEIRLPNGGTGFVAGWIVSVRGSAPKVEKPGAEMHLKNKTIVLDPGHGGRDNGTTGARGTLEKSLTLRTAQLLSDKLRAAGAHVILTRNSDSYLPLPSRVGVSHYHNADAFISLHYDSISDRTVRGMTTYYYHSFQKNLAASIHSDVTAMTNVRDRGYRVGDYHVIRENKRNAVLLELGYLSNPAEEILITSGQYQQSVTAGIYQGLARYFKN
ncbi:SH3 domain-containing protein [Cytobacillus sp. NCCP-133]|uniref:SH3 domain-containing protein n=1 Tax=Cytobacillus sp. NCCP-133 TaxID=766848 RepID=UPI002230111A|nr:SH3 domain-containing protein [Cytobacillus sp. NCCP-133]GLB58327.1 putative N-acetylmuramoyl-L-alanine amidase YrvJ [Cytobacillus sp. NCCP-133]